MPSPLRRLVNCSVCCLLFAALAAVCAKPSAAKTCDRTCLAGLITDYLQAMTTHNPAGVPLTRNVRFTENGTALKIGEGFWRTASGTGPYRQDVLDVPGHTAGTQAVLLGADNKPVLFALRLKETGGKISQIETMVVPNDKDALIFNPEGFVKDNQEIAAPVPGSQIDPRAEAIKIAMKYPEGLKIGSFVQAKTPFASDAYRIENGIHTAGPGCKLKGCENIATQDIIKHPDVRARFAAYDDHSGIVLLYLDFGQTERYGQGRKLVTFEAFKIYGGQIHTVNAILRITSVSAASGWGPEQEIAAPSSH
ncbi:MAG: hypothetical protein KGL02_02485 [Acidobacteriota bacterium]|nr:hypothetical protein [Acidobacteriota bacterium]